VQPTLVIGSRHPGQQHRLVFTILPLFAMPRCLPRAPVTLDGVGGIIGAACQRTGSRPSTPPEQCDVQAVRDIATAVGRPARIVRSGLAVDNIRMVGWTRGHPLQELDGLAQELLVS
jgi:hypothetical protein